MNQLVNETWMRVRKKSWVALRLLPSLLLAARLASAQEPSSPEVDLATQARDPSASLTAFQITFRWVDSFHQVEGADQAALVLQPVIPFRTGKQAHILRVSATVVTNSPQLNAGTPPPDVVPPNQIPTGPVEGLQDTALVDVLIWRQKWGSWGLGPVVSIPTATDSQLGSGKWTVGPAFALILRRGKLQGGVLAQGFFSVAGNKDRPDVDVVSFQPFGGYDLGGGWSLGLSEINIGYDTRRGKWTTVPFGLRLERFVRFGKVPARVFGDVEYNFNSSQVAPKWTFRFTVSPLL